MASEDRVLGRIGITLKGEYDNNKTYTKLNQVTYKGSSYTLKVAEATGILPTNSDYWICSAKKGDKGDKGDTGDIGPTGPKPINGIDYNTNAEREEFKNAVVADSKTDLEKYIAEKETQLDDYTKEKETKLDDYVTDTVKPVIDTYVTDTTKKGIDAYEKEKEKVLDTYTDTKKTEIDNYVTNTSKTALDQYEKDKEAELETAKNTAISEYDAHAESVLTETKDLFNALDTEKISGNELYIEDAKPCRAINTGVNGMYKQETTLGINIDNTKLLTTVTKHGITRTIMDDGGIKLKGTATAQWNIPVFPTELAHLEEGAYTFVCYGLPTDLSINIYYVGNVSGGTVRKFTANGTSDYYINLTVTEGTTVNCTLYPFLIKGTYTADDIPKYEPYTGKIPSPNPDYLQVIEQVDSVKLQYTGSNLLDYTKILSTPSTTSGITIKLEENGNITISGKPKYSYFSVIQSKNIIDILKDGETYYLDQSNYNRYFYTEIQAVKVDGSITYIGPQKSCASFKVNKSLFKKYVIRIIGGSLTNWGEEERTVTSNFKLTRQKNLPFEKYIEKTVNIDLKGNKLCAISDTIKDKLLIDKNGNVALQKNINYSTFDAFTTVNGSFSDRTQFILTLVNCVKGVEQNRFSAISNCMLKNTVVGGMGYYGTTTNGSVRVTVSNDLLGITQEDTTNTKLNAAKTFLQNLQQTPEIYYPAEVPELIDLGQLTELPKTFNGINNIWAETNLGNTEIEIEYVQDVKKLLEKQSEQQNARLDNIEALLSTTETSALLLDNMQTDLESEVK